MPKRLLLPRSFIVGADGRPLAGASLETYQSGTSTPKATYSDAALTIPHANPIIADSAGRFPPIFLGAGDYRTVLKDTAGTTIWTDDPVEGDAPVADTSTSAGVFTSLNGGPLGGMRNQFLNPDFAIDQRVGGSLTSASGYVADAWGFDSAGGSRTITRQSAGDPDRAAIGRDGLTHFVRYAAAGGASANHFERLWQRIESVRTFAGKQVTLSFWARRNAGSGDLATEIVQHFGTGGSPSATVTGLGAAKHTLSGSWTQISRAVNIASVIGKTLGTDDNDYLEVVFWLSAGTDFAARSSGLGVQTVTVDIADAQIEIGGVATPLEVRPLGVELAMCERRYEKSYQLGVAPGATSATAGALVNGTAQGTIGASIIQGQFRTRKRATPTLTTYDPTNGTTGTMIDAAAATSAVTVLALGQSGFAVANAALMTAASQCFVHYAAVAEL